MWTCERLDHRRGERIYAVAVVVVGDVAHVEQKNWSHVRTLVGYLRYDSPDELALLNDIWEPDAGFTNFLSAQEELISKRRDGPKVIKRYDQATTPHRRLETFTTISESVTADLDRQLAATHPAHLSRQIDSLT